MTWVRHEAIAGQTRAYKQPLVGAGLPRDGLCNSPNHYCR